MSVRIDNMVATIERIFKKQITLMALAFCLSLFAFSTPSFAQLDGVTEELDALEEQMTQEVEVLENEKDLIIDQIQKLTERSQQIAERISSIQTEQQLSLQLQDMPEFMSKSFSPCEIEATETPFEYLIKKGETQIVFPLQDAVNEVIGTISKKRVGLNSTVVIEVQIKPEWSTPENSRVEALVRLNPETLEVVHATFTGLKVNDQWYGMRSSHDLAQIVCEL